MYTLIILYIIVYEDDLSYTNCSRCTLFHKFKHSAHIFFSNCLNIKHFVFIHNYVKRRWNTKFGLNLNSRVFYAEISTEIIFPLQGRRHLRRCWLSKRWVIFAASCSLINANENANWAILTSNVIWIIVFFFLSDIYDNDSSHNDH